MKNIVFFVLLLGFFLGLTAQEKSVAMPTNKVSGEAYTFASTSVTGTNAIAAFGATDYLDKTDSSYTIEIFPNLNAPFEYYIAVKLHRLTGTGTTVVDSVTLQGRIFATESYTTIRNVKWWRTTADTVIYFDGRITGTLTGTSAGTSILDTTKIMHHASPTLNSLYYANLATTSTSLVNQQKCKYRDMRIYITQQNTTGTGKTSITGLHLKFWE